MNLVEVVRKDLRDAPRAEMYLIESETDLEEYRQHVREAAGKEFKTVLHSDIPIQKFDHMRGSTTLGQGLMRGALCLAEVNSIKEERSIWNNPIYQLLPAADLKCQTIARLLSEGEKVLVNHAGGCMPYRKKDVSIITKKGKQPLKTRPYPDPERAKRIRQSLTGRYEAVAPTVDYKGVQHGWLLPDGRLFACPYLGHIALTERIHKRVWVPDLENDWVKLSSGEWIGPFLVTQKQFDVIWDWCRANNAAMPDMFEVG